MVIVPPCPSSSWWSASNSNAATISRRPQSALFRSRIVSRKGRFSFPALPLWRAGRRWAVKPAFPAGPLLHLAFILGLSAGFFLATVVRADDLEGAEVASGLRLTETLGLSPAQVESYRDKGYSLSAGDDVIGSGLHHHLIREKDTLVALARWYGVGFNEVREANRQMEIWLPAKGKSMTVPMRWILPDSTARIVINLPEMRLYMKRHDGMVGTYPIGIGRQGFATPVGRARLLRKKEAPSWYVPASIRERDPDLPEVVPPGPENPLGSHALYLSLPGYLLHGTNEPYGIGRRVSHGCIRLYPEDVVRFFDLARVGDSVEIVHQPVKAGWFGDELHLEVHASLAEQGEVDLQVIANAVINKALAKRPGTRVMLNWRQVSRLLKEATGVPEVVSEPVAADTRAKTTDSSVPAVVPLALDEGENAALAGAFESSQGAVPGERSSPLEPLPEENSSLSVPEDRLEFEAYEGEGFDGSQSPFP